MTKVEKRNDVPRGSVLTDYFEKPDYCDSYKITVTADKSVDEWLTGIFTLPPWVGTLMNIRNAVVRIFGLKTGGAEKPDRKTHYLPGERASYFTVIAHTGNEIILGEDDKHLDFKISVLKDDASSSVCLTTLVRFNNVFGRIYFLPVKPFHKIILKTMLKKAAKDERQ